MGGEGIINVPTLAEWKDSFLAGIPVAGCRSDCDMDWDCAHIHVHIDLAAYIFKQKS